LASAMDFKASSACAKTSAAACAFSGGGGSFLECFFSGESAPRSSPPREMARMRTSVDFRRPRRICAAPGGDVSTPVESRTRDFLPGMWASESSAMARLEARFNWPKPTLKRNWSSAAGAVSLSAVKSRISSGASLYRAMATRSPGERPSRRAWIA